MAEMEELSRQSGNFCWRWRVSNAEQEKKIWEQWRWFWTWRRPSSGSVFLRCGPGRCTSAFPRKMLRVLCGYFEHERGECSSKDVWRNCSTPSRPSCRDLRIVLQDAPSEITKICPSLKLRVFVDDIKALLMGRNQELVEKAKKVLRRLKKEELDLEQKIRECSK